jgi:putative transcriptional regulator
MMGGVDSLKGQLLVAGAGLWDPNFRRTVVLVGEHTPDGALGVVLNRPSTASVAEVVPPLAPFVPLDEPMYFGGPVQPEAAVVLADLERPSDAGLLVFGSVGFLLGDVEAAATESIRRARIFAGYAGWGPGQLEHELEQDSWILEPATEEDVFGSSPQDLWPAVLRRKGGAFLLLSTMPLDPSLN